jgi:hypothetical protein
MLAPVAENATPENADSVPPSPAPPKEPPATKAEVPSSPPPRNLPPLRLREGEPETKTTGPPLGFAVFASVNGDLGTLPRPAVGFALGGSILVGRFRAEVYGAFWPNRRAEINGETADIELFDGGLRGCFSPGLPRRVRWLELGACAGIEAGALHGAGSNLAPALTETGLWLALTANARAVARISRAWGIVLDVGAALPLRRDQFTAGPSSNADVLHEAGVVEGRLSVGPELRFSAM